MGKASSAKKVARAARAGGRGARGGQRRSLLFPVSVTLVCVLGVSLIIYARGTSDEAEAAVPGLADHWHAAYGIDVCGTLQPDLTIDADPNGTHTHGDGVIHIHPGAAQQVARTGEDATLQVFLTAAGASISDDSLSFPGPDGETVTYTEGEDECDGEAGEVQVGYWANASEATDTDPQIFTEDLADIFFKNDGEAYTIAFVPDGADLQVPSTVSNLAQLGAVDSGVEDQPPPTSGAVPGGSSVPGATGTTPGGEPSGSTTVPSTAVPPAG